MPKASASAQEPTVIKVQGYRKVPFLQLSSDAGQHEVIYPGDCVFVCPPNTPIKRQPPLNGDMYWKLRIVSIHREVDSSAWVLGTWFYSREDLAEVKLLPMDKILMEKLGSTEILDSNHHQVISPLCIEAKAKIVHFDDRNQNHKQISLSTWFYRFKLIFPKVAGRSVMVKGKYSHCSCKMVYDPVDGHQRFCKGCGNWYDTMCIKLLQPGGDYEGDVSVSSVILSLPIVRGGGALAEEMAGTWRIAGTGRKVAAALKKGPTLVSEITKLREECGWSGEEMIDEEVGAWKEILPTEFLGDVFAAKFASYKCPKCPSSII